MTSYRTKRRVLPTHPVAEKVYLTCPVCAHPQVKLQGLPPYQTLQLHYKPGTQESCANHGKDYHGSAQADPYFLCATISGMQQITVHTDGGARGNPGPAGIGVAIYDADGKLMGELAEYLGEATNNVAEYAAIVRALQQVATMVNDTKAVQLTIKLDSQLVERQMNGVYKVKDATLKTYFDKAKALLPDFASVTFVHIPRSENKAADKLANQAMDAGR